MAALFGIREDASIVPVFDLKLFDVPIAPFIDEISAKDDPVKKYADIRNNMEKRMIHTDDEKLVDMEGTVWYVIEPAGKLTMWKCKPKSVEEIHWVAGINKKAILTICWNYLETEDDVNYENLLPLLIEEYDLRDIENFRQYIDKCIAWVNQEVEFIERVLNEYDKIGFSIHSDKGAVMRPMSQFFNRSEMQKVYTTIIRNQ